MHEESDRKSYIWVLAVLVLLLLGAIPVAWAGPLAQPGRQTIPPPPTPTPVIIIEEQVVEPEEPVTITITVRNEREDPMEDCVIYLEPVEGVEYIIDGEVVEAPYEIHIGTIQPGQEVVVEIVVRLTEDALPCTEYVIRIYLECEGEASVFRQVVLTAPCPALPEVGE
jgi:hypothetical protein